MSRGTFADDKRQLGEAVESGHRDHAALAIDQLEFTPVLPKGQRFAFDETDVERVRQAALDDRGANPWQCLELLLGPPGVHGEDRRAGAGAERGEDRVAICRLASFDFDVGHDEA